MFIIGEAVIEDDVAHARFACDLSKCKGACCTLPGGRGAPLEDDEVAALLQAFPFAASYIPADHLRTIAEHGAVEGVPGSYATVCVNDRACVFVFHEEGIAKCSLERAFQDGKTTWRKPISCHLFPLRIARGPAGHVRYERIAECRTGVEQGARDGVPLHRFAEPALIRKYGEAWVERFRQECDRRGSNGIE
jgi:hypothetical protein